MEKPRHFPLRHDLWDHPRTSWMYPEALAVFALVSSASILGVCSYSERKIASKTKVNLDRVPMVLSDLQQNGICKWWPADEIVWSIERADESGVAGTALVGAQREWREYPDHVRSAIAERYPVIAGELGPRGEGMTMRDTHAPSDGGYPWGTPGGNVKVKVPVPVSSDPVAQKRATEDAECATVQEGLTRIKPPGCFPLLYPDDRVRKLVRAGATAREILDVVQRAADRIESGDMDRKRWVSTFVFSGWFETLRTELADETVKREVL